jgi:glycosyltransferase involved in cell wall biosynthesis
MQIAQIVPVFPPRRGGVGRVAEEYTNGLRRRGHDVTVFTPSHPRLSGAPAHVARLVAPLRIGNAAWLPALAWRLRGFDLVHLHYPFFGGAEPVLLWKRLQPRQPLVVSYVMDANASGLKGAIFDAHQRLVLPRVLASADRLLVSSMDYARASALRHSERDLARIEVHPYGVDPVRFSPGRAPAVRAACGIAPDTPVLLFVAALDPAHHFKGLSRLLDALGTIRERRWHLIVVGDGGGRLAYEAHAARNQLGDRVAFVGDVSDAALPDYYRAADLHVFPSTAAAEAFGLVCLEAAATGIPTISSNLPGVRTVVLDGETGLHVPPGDEAALGAAIRLLLDRPDMRLRLGQAARRRVETDFDWGAHVSRLECTYEDVAAQVARVR